MSVDGEPSRPTDPQPVDPRTVSPADASRPLTGDWPAQAADVVVDLVATVRDRTVGPAQLVARVVVYGVLIVPLACMALVLVLIGLIRALDIAIPGEVWSAYLVLGALFTLVGLFLWGQRRPKTTG